jgi:hypothetical protein
MKYPIWIVVLVALVVFIGVMLLGQQLIRPNQPLILSANFDDETITPNADGVGDVTTFRYALSRNANVSLSFTAESGQTFVFRDNESRIPSNYTVLFSGVVDGFTLEGENLPNSVERRLLPNGTYTWLLKAIGTDGEEQEASGTFTIEGADTPLPIMSSFTVGPTNIFSPNQDGIADRVEISVYLEQPADLRVFLLAEDGTEIPISERLEGRRDGEAGRFAFDYEGGIDLGADPPPDGTYSIVAIAQDLEGQRTRIESTLTIVDGGKPQAEIAPQAVGVDVVFTVMPYDERYFSNSEALGDFVEMPNNPADLVYAPITMQVGDMLVFKLTVDNYNDVPIRTTYPPPGTVYQQDQLSASLSALESSGAWRVGIQCETSETAFPYRWALGDENTLEVVVDEANGNTFYYLPARTRIVVWGAIHMTDIDVRQNPQTCWAGLIQEDVDIAPQNRFVGPREIELVDPNAQNQNGG